MNGRAIVLTLVMLFVGTGIGLRADEVTDGYRRDLAQAQREGNVEEEALARERLAVTYYNRLEFDSLEAIVPEQMAFYKSRQDWDHYYYTWRIMISAYIYSNKNQTALRECKKMYEDAQLRGSDYGIAMSSHVMGLAYSNIRYYEEARSAMERCLNSSTTQGEPFMQVSVYGDYCEVLGALKDYAALREATQGWHRALWAWGENRGMTHEEVDSTVYATYCFVAQAKAERGLHNFEEAERLLQTATRNAKLYGEDSNEGHWHHVLTELAELAMEREQFDAALRYNDELLGITRERDIDTEMSGVEYQRAESLANLSRYEEAATLFKKVCDDHDAFNLRDAKAQLSEMSSLFRLDEMEMEQQRTRSRYIVIIASLIIVSLLVIGLFIWQAARRLSQKNRELAIALDHAQESDRMKTAFIQHVSHEIRTPLNIITGFTQVLNAPDYAIGDEERSSMMDRIGENTQLMTRIVNELIELSDMESQRIIERNDRTTARELMLTAIGESNIGPTAEVGFEQDCRVADEVVLKTDAASVVKILRCLLSNAQMFTHQGCIRLTAEADEREVRFTVSDTGIGVPAEDRERIFEKFEKVDKFSTGIGLGLSVSRTLARHLGGDVVLVDSSSKGSTFCLHLPRV